MGTIYVKLHDGQEFEYDEAPRNGGRYYELENSNNYYTVVAVMPNDHAPDQKSVKRQFPKCDVADIRRL